ncbi:MAG: hypothetical protein HYU03_00325 [Thaumarchaeota archaeon]|nr:hypothetical protein [Nitrososphaerota archaeon]
MREQEDAPSYRLAVKVMMLVDNAPGLGIDSISEHEGLLPYEGRCTSETCGDCATF